jgi:GT2 family glycosyltransferase
MAASSGSEGPADRIRWLVEQQIQLEARLAAIENSLTFRILRGLGLFGAAQKRKLGQAILHSPLHKLVATVSSEPAITREYAAWRERRASSAPSLAEAGYQPLISVVCALHNPERRWFEEAVESVRGQSYPRWQLCLCDDASSAVWVRPYLEELARHDPRIVYTLGEESRGISGAMNGAASLASGEYLAFLDHDDLLAAPHALAHVAAALQERRYHLLYSDEDYIDAEGRAVRPRFKPGWSPLLLEQCMYMGHLLVVRRDVFEGAGGFRGDYDGAQDYDLALRIAREGAATVRHIPEVLYRWRQHGGSTAAAAAAKPYTQEAGRRALAGALERSGVTGARVVDGEFPNSYRILRNAAGATTPASIVICSRNPKLLETCLRAVRRTSAEAEIVVVHHESGSGGPEDARLENVVSGFGARRVPYRGEFHFSRMNNLGAREATGEVLVFLNDDTEPLAPHWLRSLVDTAMRRDVGAVGAKLIYPNGTLQHAGMAVGILDGAGHPGRGLLRSDSWPWLDYTREVSAVTGACLATRRRVFEQLGGWEEAFPVNYNDVDYCLRARQAGYVVVYESRAVLRHAEAQTRAGGTRYEERQAFFDRWSRVLEAGDPFYSPNLTRSREDAGL